MGQGLTFMNVLGLDGDGPSYGMVYGADHAHYAHQVIQASQPASQLASQGAQSAPSCSVVAFMSYVLCKCKCSPLRAEN